MRSIKSIFFTILPLLFINFYPLQITAAQNRTLPTVGMLVPLSGNYSAIGNDNRQGAEVALAQLGKNAKLRLTYEDTKADPTVAISIFRSLVTNGTIAAFIMRSPVGMAINPVSHSLQIPIVGGVGNKDFSLINEYAFQAWSSSDYEGAFLANHLIARDYKRIAIVTAQDDWLVSIADGFETQLANRGVTPVFNAEILPSDSDFRSVLSRIQNSKPDCIFINLALMQTGPFLKQARELRIPSALF